MPRRDFSKVAFAATGDTNSIPTATQPDGSVSIQQGFGFDYQRDNGAGGGTPDPLAKNIDREDMNGILNEITASIGEIQRNGYAEWVSSAAPYPIYATVRYNDINWGSVVANNSDTPGVGPGIDSWRNLSLNLSGVVRRITASGVVAPTTGGVKFWKVRGIAGGGGGGGCVATNSTQVAAGAGGASGSWFETILTAAQIGSGLNVIVGSGGAAGAAGGSGGTGGATSIGGVSAPGGGGGTAGGAIATSSSAATGGGIPGGVATGATLINSDGVQGDYGLTLLGTSLSGKGASTYFGAGGRQSGPAIPGSGHGSGGGGAGNSASSPARVGSAGAPGVIFIEEIT